MTIEEARKRCLEIAEQYGYKLAVPVEANGRLKSTLGRVRYTIRGKKCYPAKIEFSSDLLKRGGREAEETIAHEMAHYFVLLDTKENHGHDELWKRWAVKLGARPRATVKREETGAEIKPCKYILICSRCGKVAGRYVRKSRAVVHPEKYRSACCRAKIKVMVRND